MKKLLFCFVFLGLVSQVNAKAPSYDTTAVMILDHMSRILGELTSCSFTLTVVKDVPDPDLGVVISHEVSDVSFYGPDKMQVNKRGVRGHQGYWYNGTELSWYSYSENNFVVIAAPDNIIDMIDSLNATYGIEFPAADFFYPTFTDDMITQFEQITYRGTSMLGDRNCFQVAARNAEMSVQLWISNDATFLPVKMVISYTGKSDVQRYEATFSGWQINPELPSAMFDFTPPPGANQVTILAKQPK